MKFLSPSQCRAARGLLDWSQPELAKRCGIHVQTISAFEHESGTPTKRTLQKITSILEKHGIVFTEKGIEYVENPVFFIEGNSHEECYLRLLEDAFDHLKDKKNSELLIMYADDRVSPPSVNDFYRKMRRTGIKMRQLIEEGNTYIIGPLEEYRYIPKGFFINRVTLVYGDRIGTETANFNRVLVKIDVMNAEIQRNTFNLLWKVLKQPAFSVAQEKFE